MEGLTRPIEFGSFFDHSFEEVGLGGRPSEVVCDGCQLGFKTMGILEMHRQKVHDSPAVEDCERCNSKFKRRLGLIVHFRTFHRDPAGNRALVGCDICDAFLLFNGFISHKDLERHTKQVHGESVFLNQPEGQNRSYCPLCMGEFKYRKGMIEHLQVLHGEHLLVDLLQTSGEEMERLLEDRRFKCKYCSRMFTVKKSLVQHLEKVHFDYEGHKEATKNTNLPSLAKALVRRGGGRRKRAKSLNLTSIKTEPGVPAKRPRIGLDGSCSSDDPVACETCGKAFSRQSVLNVHIKMVHGGVLHQPPAASQQPQVASKLFTQELSGPVRPKRSAASAIKKKYEMMQRKAVAASMASRLIKAASNDLNRTRGARDKEPTGTTCDNSEAAGESAGLEASEDTETIKDDDPRFYNEEELESADKEQHDRFYGESVPCHANAPADQARELCLYNKECNRQFVSYFSMMRHVAFHHRPDKTLGLMKLKKVARRPIKHGLTC